MFPPGLAGVGGLALIKYTPSEKKAANIIKTDTVEFRLFGRRSNNFDAGAATKRIPVVQSAGSVGKLMLAPATRPNISAKARATSGDKTERF
jgi:hypothetical protein